MTALRVIRRWVLATSGWPLLRTAYRGVYALQIRRARDALREQPGIDAALLRGSEPATVTAGLSDIDLCLLLADGATPEARVQTMGRVVAALARVNLGVPLVRDVHAFTPAGLRLSARLSTGLYAGLLHDTRTLFGAAALPETSDDPTLLRETLLRERCYWLAMTLRHLQGDDPVAAALADRSFAKALVAERVMEAPVPSLRALWLGYAEKARVSARVESVLTALARADRCLGTGPPLEVPAASPPGRTQVLEQVEELRTWFAPLARHPAVVAALLGREGPADPRTYVVVDPAHSDAPDLLAALRAAARTFPRPRQARLGWPLVVTRRMLERAVFLRWTAFEPAVRPVQGLWLVGEPIGSRATRGELARAVLHEVASTEPRLLELLGEAPGPRARAMLAAIEAAFLPSVRALARHEPLPAISGATSDATGPAARARVLAAWERCLEETLPLLTAEAGLTGGP